MSYRVYSPDNEPFDIASEDRANDLVLNQGWTKTPQVAGEPPAVQATVVDEDDKPAARGRGRGRAKPAAEPVVETVEEDAPTWRGYPLDDEPASLAEAPAED